MSSENPVDALFKKAQPSSLAGRILGTEKLEIPEEKPERTPSKSEAEEISEDERLRRTVVICNLPNKCTARDIKKLFDKGVVVNVRFRAITLAQTKLPRKVAVRRGAIDEDGTCNAYVFVKTPADVTNAIDRLNGTTFMEKVLRVDQATAPGKKGRVDKETNRKSVFIGHVPFDMTEEELRDVFSSCGAIHHVRIPRDEKGKGRGIAYVTFEEEESVDFALKFNQAEVRGQVLHVERSNPAKGEKTKKKHEAMKQKKGGAKGKATVAAKEKVKPKAGAKTEKKKDEKPSFEGRRAKAHMEDKNKAIKTYLKMRAHVKRKRQGSVKK